MKSYSKIIKFSFILKLPTIVSIYLKMNMQFLS